MKIFRQIAVVMAFLTFMGCCSRALGQSDETTHNRLGQVVIRLQFDPGPPEMQNPHDVSYNVGTKERASELMVRWKGQSSPLSVRFDSLLENEELWPPDTLNDIHYQLSRGFYCSGAYQLFGLVRTGGHAYLGLRFYSPASSWSFEVGVFVFELHVKDGMLEITSLREPRHSREYFGDEPDNRIELSKSSKGELALQEGRQRLVYQSSGKWRRIAPPANRRHMRAGQVADLLTRDWRRHPFALNF